MSKKKNRRWANKEQKSRMAVLAEKCFPEINDEFKTQEPIILNKTITRYK